MMLNLDLRYDNILLWGQSGSLHLPPVALTTWMKGIFTDSVDEICTNLILLIRGLCQYKTKIKRHINLRIV